jgi:hypothetical protein
VVGREDGGSFLLVWLLHNHMDYFRPDTYVICFKKIAHSVYGPPWLVYVSFCTQHYWHYYVRTVLRGSMSAEQKLHLSGEL